MQEREIFYERHPDPMWIYDLATLRFLDVNEAAVAAYGYGRDEFLQMTVLDIRPPEDVPRLLEDIDAARQNQSRTGVWRHLRKSGELLFAEISARPVEWEGRAARLIAVRDVTRTIRAEQDREALLAQLAEQNANLRTAQRLIQMGAWKMDIRSNRLIWSAEALDIYGLSDDGFGGSPEVYFDLVHPEDRRDVAAEYAMYSQSGEADFDFSHRIVRPDGRVIHVRGIGAMADTPDGPMLTGIVQDVTRQVERENRLLVLDHSVSRLNDMVLIFEATAELEGTQAPVVYVNPSFLRLTGLQAGDVLGQPISEVMRQTAPGVPMEVLVQSLANAVSLRSDIRIFTREGRAVPAEIDLVPVKGMGGMISHWVAVVRDMSDKHAAEALAKSNEERYQMLARSTHDVVWDFDLAAERITWNENFRELAGDPAAPLEDDSSSWIDRLHPDDRDRVMEGFYGATSGDAVTWSDEYRFMRDDGDVRFVLDRGFISRDARGKAERIVGSMVDITAQKLAEARLAQSEKIEALGRITGGVAHDFNNLLMIITGNTETLLERTEDTRERRLLELVLSAAERGRDLTGRLLAFARRIPLKPALLDLDAQVARAAELYRRTFRANLDLQLDLGASGAQIEGDGSQLELVLLNLAVNARDAMQDGGVLTLRTRVLSGDDGDTVALTVSDTGDGMDAETLRRCLDPFFTTKQVGQGVGLGLSMAFGFMQQSGGTLKIESEPGRGTHVTLLFPAAAGDGRRDVSDAPALVAGQGEKILLVEDDAGVRQHVNSTLAALGYQVTDCASPDAAIEWLAGAKELDLILTDLIMPGKADVRELVAQALQKFPDVKVLYSSGYPPEFVARDGRLAANIELLPKPYRKAELAARLRQLLEGEVAARQDEA